MMTGDRFREIRRQMGLNQTDLARVMATPLRTIQDIEGQRSKPVRGVYAVCITLLHERDKDVMVRIQQRIDQEIARDFPGGIPSDTRGDDD